MERGEGSWTVGSGQRRSGGGLRGEGGRELRKGKVREREAEEEGGMELTCAIGSDDGSEVRHRAECVSAGVTLKVV